MLTRNVLLFFMLRKIHTDHSTIIVSLMGRKYNCDECCTEVELDHQLLAKCKKAILSSLNKEKILAIINSIYSHSPLFQVLQC